MLIFYFLFLPSSLVPTEWDTQWWDENEAWICTDLRSNPYSTTNGMALSHLLSLFGLQFLYL